MEVRKIGYPRPETAEEWAELICQRSQFLADLSQATWELIPEESRSSRDWSGSHLLVHFKPPVVCFWVFTKRGDEVFEYDFLVYRGAVDGDDIVVIIEQPAGRGQCTVYIRQLDIEHWRKK